MTTYVCKEIAQVNNQTTCVTYVAKEDFDLFNISVADADALLSQILVVFATVWLANVVSDMFKKG
ncbi:TPA: hypothetical protein ACNIH0_003932 [Acinetobacter baumannii]|uniref:hypothetical protein n=1 Tax=Acinetobacter oleivorans TaxID=1148157 RepID=UPI00178CAE4E|nr:hypothetical protein [Acinetobacter oleivorans]MBE2173660.1 hypothetical protein [Acinetobacter oleivorans]